MGLGSEIREVRFSPVRLSPGYDMGEVDALLDALARAADRGDRLTLSRWREGCHPGEVEEFLDRLTGVRPGAPTGGGGPVVQKRRGTGVADVWQE